MADVDRRTSRHSFCYDWNMDANIVGSHVADNVFLVNKMIISEMDSFDYRSCLGAEVTGGK